MLTRPVPGAIAEGIPFGWFDTGSTIYPGPPGKSHSGKDWLTFKGTPCWCRQAGYVTWAYELGQLGNYVQVMDYQGRFWGLAHLSEIYVSVGQYVGAGEIVGLTGGVPGEPGAGFTTGEHLHEELRVGWQWGERIDPDMATLEELEQLVLDQGAQIADLTARLNGVAQQGTNNIQTDGNMSMLGDRPPGSPLKFFIGKDFQRGLYFFFQERFPGQGTELWGGFETYQAPPDGDPTHASWGYGALPGRAWFQNFLLEANGDNVSRNVVTNRIYLQVPAHRNLSTGVFEKPSSYSPEGVPLAADGSPLGGIYPDFNDLGTYFAREGDQVVLYINGAEAVRWGP